MNVEILQRDSMSCLYFFNDKKDLYVHYKNKRAKINKETHTTPKMRINP